MFLRFVFIVFQDSFTFNSDFKNPYRSLPPGFIFIGIIITKLINVEQIHKY